MDPDERHEDPPMCDYTVRVTIVKEVTVRDYLNRGPEELMEGAVDEIKNWLEEDDITAIEITDANMRD